ncbi:uncharacterized protein LOC126372642 [Pectinophora gossypiella]|uniref:uncharacterized protein LOC126372642 n=1 Tax=Pectinophora gossypiella TaxID=13191 RepID=UPI00214E17D6|nr:uncharacterized protein LOC126372642 [Pectinophora gossypiella]
MWWLWWATVAWIMRARSAIEITGEVSFDLRISEDGVPPSPPPPAPPLPPAASAPPAPPAQAVRAQNSMTAAPPVECVYQYPETRQVNAMLSNMMNQLTKVFVRMHKSMSPEVRRSGAKRFRLVSSKQSDFFDHIYANMTEEYRRFVNETSHRVPSAGDPCRHQEELRDVWRSLLDTSQVRTHRPDTSNTSEAASPTKRVWSPQESLRRAALRCVQEYLRVQQRAASPRQRARAAALLRRELGRVRSEQLALLCDSFQLCYSELQ